MLRILASTWGTVAGARTSLYEHGWLPRKRLDRPVISVGGLSVGGAGKTPTAALVASLLSEAGVRPAILSRGYRRSGNEPLLVAAGDGQGPQVDWQQAGDEPFWLASALPNVPVAVAARREEAARMVAGAGPVDVFVLDDGFQHIRVARDADLLVVNPEAPFWDDQPMPAGRLREPPAAAHRADAFLLVGEDADAAATLARRFPSRPCFTLTPQPARCWDLADDVPPAHATAGTPVAAAAATGTTSAAADDSSGTTSAAADDYSESADAASPEGAGNIAEHLVGPVFAFAGIARPERFFTDLETAGATLCGTRAFGDHHAYALDDLRALAQTARDVGATRLLTTEKDAVRLPRNGTDLPVSVWSYRLSATAPDELRDWLMRRAGLTTTEATPEPASASGAEPAAGMSPR